MRGLLEFTMEELISTQIVISETFHRMQDQLDNNLDQLREQRDIYAQKSIDALHLLWSNFDDNNYLLIEAQVKDDKYFTDKLYDKVKEEYFSIMPVLRQYAVDELSDEYYISKRFTTKFPSQLELHIHHQRLRFKAIEKDMNGINMDSIRDVDKMEDWQNKLKQQWVIIEKCHKTITNRFPEMWPDLSYELEYVQYKNMYETTYSLFNYKIDAELYPIVRVIPHIGIPTWRMFDNASDIHPFAVKSVAWANFEGLGDVMRNNRISEGEKRQLLIRTFLTYQHNYQPVSPEDLDWEERANHAYRRFPQLADEPLLFPLIQQID